MINHCHSINEAKYVNLFYFNLKSYFIYSSSSHSSPPSSDLCTRISDSENTHVRSPSDSTASVNNSTSINSQLRVEAARNEMQRYSPNLKIPSETDLRHNFNVPIFVLHAKGSYYVPLTIDYKTLLPFLQNYDILEVMPTLQNVVLHPVTINVNFLPNFNNLDPAAVGKCKTEYVNNWH